MRLVLLPGLDGTGVYFEPLCAVLPAEIQATVVTYPATTVRSYDALAVDVLQTLPTDEPFVLLGESFGGPLALKVAAMRPPGLCGLILCATFVRCPQPFVPKWASHLVPPIPRAVVSMLVKTKAMAGGYGSSAQSSLTNRGIATVAPAVIAARMRAVVTVDVRQELQSCPHPILYLQGAQDFVVPPRNLREIQALRPDVQVARFKAPHMVLQTQAEAAGREIAAFARTLATQARA